MAEAFPPPTATRSSVSVTTHPNNLSRRAEEIVTDMQESGEPPVAIADRHYSGKFQVRVPEEVHRLPVAVA
jgi:predicted HicB family RNase H-like nuclease